MIDLSNYKYFFVKCNEKKRRIKSYATYCDKCHKEKGYFNRGYGVKHPLCNTCAQIGKTLSEDDRQNKRLAAFKRYNDISWMPKDRSRKVYQPRISKPKQPESLQKRIGHSMRTLIVQKIKNRGFTKSHNRTFAILNYSPDQLIQHLESLFQPRMSWNNYGRGGWHIDHVIPDSWFSYMSFGDEGFKRSWALDNLQPMWEIDNAIKGDRFSGRGMLCQSV